MTVYKFYISTELIVTARKQRNKPIINVVVL